MSKNNNGGSGIDFSIIDTAKKIWGIWNNEDQSVALTSTFMTVAFSMWLFTNRIDIVYVVLLGFIFLGVTITKHIADYYQSKMFIIEQKEIAKHEKAKVELIKQLEIISSKHNLNEEAREIMLDEIISFLKNETNEGVNVEILKLFSTMLKKLSKYSHELTKDIELPFKDFIENYYKPNSYDVIEKVPDVVLDKKSSETLKNAILENNLEGIDEQINENTEKIENYNRIANNEFTDN